MADNYFTDLNSVDVSGKTEKKNGLTYLSWAWAWGELKKRHPEATYTVYENANGWNYHTDGNTAWVKTGVTVNGIEHIEYLPVMDFRNRSIPVANITSFDVNKTIQRSLTKSCARHGLGLFIYAGEDLPEDAETKPTPKKNPTAIKKASEPKLPTTEQKVALKNLVEVKGLNLAEILKKYGIEGQMTLDQYNKIMTELKGA